MPSPTPNAAVIPAAEEQRLLPIGVELDIIGRATVRLDDADGISQRGGVRLESGLGGGGGDAGGKGEGGEGSVAGGGGEEDVGVVVVVEEDGAEEGAAGDVPLPQDAPPVRRLVPPARVRPWLRLRRRHRCRHLLAVLALGGRRAALLLLRAVRRRRLG